MGYVPIESGAGSGLHFDESTGDLVCLSHGVVIWRSKLTGSNLITFDTPVFDDYLVGAASFKIDASAPDWAVLRGNCSAYAFDGNAISEQAWFDVHILHGIKAGTFPTFHVHWSHKEAAPTGNVKWNLSYSYAKGYGAGTFASDVVLSTTQAAGAQYGHFITPDDDMPTATAPEPDSKLICRIWRDPGDVADTFAADAYLLGVDLHYQRGQLGTIERNRPFTSAGFGA